MRRYFEIQLKWLDEECVTQVLVTDYDDVDPLHDEDIFWHGLSEEQIQYHIRTGERVCHMFVILDYIEVKF